jgi:hypothetical protein
LSPELKAIVFKTTRLKKTRDFFEKELGMKISECSGTHFVIHESEIRILFVESDGSPEPELYLRNHCSKQLTVYEDPNQIKIVIC